MGDGDVKPEVSISPITLLNLMGVTTETFIRREFVPQDDSRRNLRPFCRRNKVKRETKGGLVAFILV